MEIQQLPGHQHQNFASYIFTFNCMRQDVQYILFWLQALELFSLLTVRVALSQAEANLLQELATHSLQDNEELQDDTGSVYSYGI